MMEFELSTSAGVVYRGRVGEVLLETAAGRMAVLPGHEDYLAVAVPGAIRVRESSGGVQAWRVSGGIFEVRGGVAKLYAEVGEPVSDEAEDRVEAARARAEELQATIEMKEGIHRAEELLDRHPVRLEVAKLRRRRRSRHR